MLTDSITHFTSHCGASTSLPALQLIVALANTSEALRQVLDDIGAKKAIQLGFSAAHVPPLSLDSNLILWSNICLACLSSQPMPDLSRVEPKSAEHGGIGPNALVRRFCGSLLESHRLARGCPNTPSPTKISLEDVINTACSPCARCNEQLLLVDDDCLLLKMLDYARCAFAFGFRSVNQS